MIVICVLRSGGVYFPGYVSRLQQAVEKHMTVPHEFVCLTDVDFLDIPGCTVIPLKHNWPGWWSKIELFHPDLPDDYYLYFDLDTLILKNINGLAAVSKVADFMMLKGFNPASGGRHPSSGVMVGRFPRMSKIYTKFMKDPGKNIARTQLNSSGIPGQDGDQGFIGKVVGWNIPKIQDHLPDDYIIGKRHFHNDPNSEKKAHVLAWSGSPRLHESSKLLIHRYWRKYEPVQQQ